MGQDKLWITQPNRTTCIAQVTALRGEWFAVDKALFAPKSHACRHPQNHDKGTIWLAGEKRRLEAIRGGETVWYKLRGTTPELGTQLQCQLNQEIREMASRAHTALHLWITSTAPDWPPMVEDPEVKGGGHFRITYEWAVRPEQLAACLAKCNQMIANNLEVERDFLAKDGPMHGVTAQHFSPPDKIPGPDPIPVVRIGNSCLPCDGTHVSWTGKIGNLVVSHARMGKTGFVVGGRVEP